MPQIGSLIDSDRGVLAPVEAAVGAARAPRVSPLVLVVDDDATTIRTVGAILKQAGFRIATASDVAGAMDGIREKRPDLVLLDVGLPDGTGFDVCRMLQTDSAAARTPVIFISAHDDVSMKVQGFESGGVDYITKPIAATEVLARVRTHLRLKQAYERLADLQAERLERLAAAQQATMPRPEDLPEARFEVSLRQVLKAGGDFYDVIPAGDGIADYLVADSSGHDLAASYWTAALKALAAEYGSPVNPPVEVVANLNRSLCRILPAGAFFTLIYARLNRQNGRLAVVNAGHPPALLIPGNADEILALHRDGDVVGAFPDAVFGLSEFVVRPGDRLVLYSDGLIECGTTREEGMRRLVAACTERRRLALDRLVPALLEALIPDVAADDVVLMVVEA